MEEHGTTRSLSAIIGEIERDARFVHGVPESVVLSARQSTYRAMRELAVRPLGARDGDRVRSYFWAVVRRRSIRASDSRMRLIRERTIAYSILQDLRESGRDDAAIMVELERALGGVVPPEVVEEIRPRLCG